MSDEQLADVALESEQLLFARARPEHKMRVVAALQDRGEAVAVTGDGVNDAPALKRASIGVSMGEGGTDVARAASVMILLDDSFASIVAAVELGRTVYQNIRKFLIYLFSHNLAELAPILVAVFVGFPLVPLSALQVLVIDLGSDVLVRSGVPAYLAGRRVAEFNVPGEIGVVELSRTGHSKIPDASTLLEDGDVLSFIVAAASLGRLRSFLGEKWS